MTDQQKYDAVLACEDIESLVQLIRDFSHDGVIDGLTESFDADRMCNNAMLFYKDVHDVATTVTRKYGLRRQLIYLKYYKMKEG